MNGHCYICRRPIIVRPGRTSMCDACGSDGDRGIERRFRAFRAEATAERRQAAKGEMQC